MPTDLDLQHGPVVRHAAERTRYPVTNSFTA